MGFRLEQNQYKIIESVGLLLVIVKILPVTFNKASDVLLHIHFVLPILPTLVLYGASSYDRQYILMVVISFLLVIFISKRKTKIIKVFRVKERTYVLFVLALILVMVLSMITVGKLRYFNLDISRVYEFRVAARESLPHIFEYIHHFLSKTLLPILLVFSLVSKRYVFAIVSLAISVFVFGITQHKASLMFSFSVVIIYYLLSFKKRNIVLGFILGCIILFLISFFLESTRIGALIQFLFSRRVFLIPAMLNYEYFEFFDGSIKTIWSQSKITLGVLDYPYAKGVPYLIGEKIGFEEAHANTGWLGAGYQNLGVMGMLIYAILIGKLLSIIDGLSKRIGSLRQTIAILFPSLLWLFISSDPLVVLITHGMIYSLLLLLIFPEHKFSQRGTSE